MEALRNKEDCNPVLRSLFKATLSIAEREDPERYKKLQAKVAVEKTVEDKYSAASAKDELSPSYD